MAVRVTGEEVMRWALRLSSRRSLWQQCGPQILTRGTSVRGISSSDSRSPLTWSTRHSQTILAGRPVGSVRYFSQGRIKGLEEKQRLSIQQSRPSSSPNEILSGETDSEPTPRRAMFYDKLRECVSPTDVLDLVAEYTPTSRRVSNCLTHIWEISKKMTEDQRRYEIQLMFEHPGFEELLQRAMQGARHMRNEDLTYSLLAAVKLGVSHRSRVVQILLRTCQENINSMNEKSLSVLASCLENMDDSPNVSALKQGMRLAVDDRLPSIKKVMALQTMMRLVGNDAPLDLKKKLEIKALSMADQFSLPNSQYMITTMAAMNFYSKPLLDICSKKIAENVHSVPFPRLLGVLRSCKELHYRDLDLLTVISDHMASSMDIWSNKQVVLVLSGFEDLSFCPAALMEAFAERVIRDPASLTSRDLLSVLKTYSSLNHDLQDHRQQFLDSLSQVLESYLSKMPGYEVLKAVYCLCLLGHFPSAPLEHLLQGPTLEDLSTAGSKHFRGQEKKLQTVDLCLRLDRPSLPRPLTVPTHALGVPVPGDLSVNPELSRTLQSVVEGVPGATLQETVVVENSYLIDGVITTPLAVTEGSGPAEKEPSPAGNNSQRCPRIAVICAPRFAICHGTCRPRGLLAIKIRHLKALGYTPFVVLEKELESMSEEERTEALRRKIFPEHQGSDAEPLAA